MKTQTPHPVNIMALEIFHSVLFSLRFDGTSESSIAERISREKRMFHIQADREHHCVHESWVSNFWWFLR